MLRQDGSAIGEQVRKVLDLDRKVYSREVYPGGHAHFNRRKIQDPLDAGGDHDINDSLVFFTQMVMVMVMAVDKREDGAVYQSSIARVSEMLLERAKAVPKRQ